MEETLPRHGVSRATRKNFAYWSAILAITCTNASYEENIACLPVRIYPCVSPMSECSLSISITLPSREISLSHTSVGHTKGRAVAPNTSSSLLEYVSSGDMRRKFLASLFNSKSFFRYIPVARILLDPTVPGADVSSENACMSGNTRSLRTRSGNACLHSPMRRSPSGMRSCMSLINPFCLSNSSWNAYERIHFSTAFNCARSVFASVATTWCARQLPSILSLPSFLMPVHPLSVFKMIIGKCGATMISPPRARCWRERIS